MKNLICKLCYDTHIRLSVFPYSRTLSAQQSCFPKFLLISIKLVSLSHPHPNLPILFLHIKHKRMLFPPLRIFLLLLIPFLPFLNETIVDQVLRRKSCLHRFVIIVKKANIIALSLEPDIYTIPITILQLENAPETTHVVFSAFSLF